MGSIMVGLIQARRVADEQTAALAEYYKDHPLLEGLSVPRIRIPELTIDVPMLIDGHSGGSAGEIADSGSIAKSVGQQLSDSSKTANLKLDPTVSKAFADNVKADVESLRTSNVAVTKEAVSRTIQDSLARSLDAAKINLDPAVRTQLIQDVRAKAADVALSKAPVMPTLSANINTADVKDKAGSGNVVRLTITLKEEGLEWSTSATTDGGVKRTLQPE